MTPKPWTLADLRRDVYAAADEAGERVELALMERDYQRGNGAVRVLVCADDLHSWVHLDPMPLHSAVYVVMDAVMAGPPTLPMTLESTSLRVLRESAEQDFAAGYRRLRDLADER